MAHAIAATSLSSVASFGAVSAQTGRSARRVAALPIAQKVGASLQLQVHILSTVVALQMRAHLSKCARSMFI